MSSNKRATKPVPKASPPKAAEKEPLSAERLLDPMKGSTNLQASSASINSRGRVATNSPQASPAKKAPLSPGRSPSPPKAAASVNQSKAPPPNLQQPAAAIQPKAVTATQELSQQKTNEKSETIIEMNNKDQKSEEQKELPPVVAPPESSMVPVAKPTAMATNVIAPEEEALRLAAVAISSPRKFPGDSEITTLLPRLGKSESEPTGSFSIIRYLIPFRNDLAHAQANSDHQMFVYLSWVSSYIVEFSIITIILAYMMIEHLASTKSPATSIFLMASFTSDETLGYIISIYISTAVIFALAILAMIHQTRSAASKRANARFEQLNTLAEHLHRNAKSNPIGEQTAKKTLTLPSPEGATAAAEGQRSLRSKKGLDHLINFVVWLFVLLIIALTLFITLVFWTLLKNSGGLLIAYGTIFAFLNQIAGVIITLLVKWQNGHNGHIAAGLSSQAKFIFTKTINLAGALYFCSSPLDATLSTKAFLNFGNKSTSFLCKTDQVSWGLIGMAIGYLILEISWTWIDLLWLKVTQAITNHQPPLVLRFRTYDELLRMIQIHFMCWALIPYSIYITVPFLFVTVIWFKYKSLLLRYLKIAAETDNDPAKLMNDVGKLQAYYACLYVGYIVLNFEYPFEADSLGDTTSATCGTMFEAGKTRSAGIAHVVNNASALNVLASIFRNTSIWIVATIFWMARSYLLRQEKAALCEELQRTREKLSEHVTLH